MLAGFYAMVLMFGVIVGYKETKLAKEDCLSDLPKCEAEVKKLPEQYPGHVSKLKQP